MRKCSDHTLTPRSSPKPLSTHAHMQTGFEGKQKVVKMKVKITEVKSEIHFVLCIQK